MSTQEDWLAKLTTLPCKVCKYYWQDVKYCTKYEILVFTKEFNKIQTDKCLEKVKDEINMCNLSRRKLYE